MKTLDEVIRWYENRKSTLIGKATKEEMEDSILHYLKEYQAILPLVPSLINTALEVQKKGKTIG